AGGRHHRHQPGRRRHADRRGAGQAGRRGGALDAAWHGDPLRRGRRAGDGPQHARRQGHQPGRRRRGGGHGGHGPGRLPLDGVRERLGQADAVRRKPPGRGAGGVGRGGGGGGVAGGGGVGRGRFGGGGPREFAAVLPQAAPRRQGHPRHPDDGAERSGGGRGV